MAAGGRRESRRSLPGDTIPPDLLLLPALLIIALAPRLVRIDAFSDHYDEGVYLESLFLMTAGHAPVAEVFSSQGPLFLPAVLPFYALLGQTIVAARLGLAAFSLAGVAGVYWAGRTLGGRLAGMVASLLMVLSPLYLRNSRLVLAEVPALALAALAIAAALAYHRSGALCWAAAAGAMLAGSLLIKPLTLGAAPAVLLAVIARRGGTTRALGLLTVSGAVVTLMVVLPLGPAQIYHQVVSLHTAMREAAGVDLVGNLELVWNGLLGEGYLVLALAGLGLLSTVRPSRIDLGTMVVPVWLVTQLCILLAHAPLYPRHVTALVVPLDVLAGIGTTVAMRPVARSIHASGDALCSAAPRGPSRPWVTAGLAITAVLALVLWVRIDLPPVLAANRGLLETARSDRYPRELEAAADLAWLLEPEEWVVTDHQYVAFWARRGVPPPLVDTSFGRLTSGSLTATDVIAIARDNRVKAVLPWSHRLTTLPEFSRWMDQELFPVRTYDQRALFWKWSDEATARTRVASSLEASGQEFGGQMRLLGYRVAPSRIHPGDEVNVTLLWQSLATMKVDYHAFNHLLGPDGRLWGQMDRRVGGDVFGTSRWRPGQWMVERYRVEVDHAAPAGPYLLHVGLYDLASMQRLTLASGGDAFTIGPLQVVHR